MARHPAYMIDYSTQDIQQGGGLTDSVPDLNMHGILVSDTSVQVYCVSTAISVLLRMLPGLHCSSAESLTLDT